MPISVVIPTFKRPELLANAIRSVLDQSVAPAEIIISDNDPAHSARSVASEFDTKYVDSSSESGASHARNSGEAIATSEWIAFLDDDDTWQSDYLKHVVDIAEAADNTSLVLSWIQYDQAGTIAGEKHPHNELTIEGILTTGNPGITGSNIFIQSDVFRKLSGFDESMPASEDIDLLIRFMLGKFTYKTNEILDVNLHGHSGDQLSDLHARSIYNGRQILYEKYNGKLTRSARRTLRGRIHLAGYESSTNLAQKLRHLFAAIYYGDYGPTIRLINGITGRR